jgi:hypothetical protein
MIRVKAAEAAVLSANYSTSPFAAIMFLYIHRITLLIPSVLLNNVQTFNRLLLQFVLPLNQDSPRPTITYLPCLYLSPFQNSSNSYPIKPTATTSFTSINPIALLVIILVDTATCVQQIYQFSSGFCVSFTPL